MHPSNLHAADDPDIVAVPKSAIPNREAVRDGIRIAQLDFFDDRSRVAVVLEERGEIRRQADGCVRAPIAAIGGADSRADAGDFLQLSDDERRFIETKLALALSREPLAVDCGSPVAALC